MAVEESTVLLAQMQSTTETLTSTQSELDNARAVIEERQARVAELERGLVNAEEQGRETAERMSMTEADWRRALEEGNGKVCVSFQGIDGLCSFASILC